MVYDVGIGQGYRKKARKKAQEISRLSRLDFVVFTALSFSGMVNWAHTTNALAHAIPFFGKDLYL